MQEANAQRTVTFIRGLGSITHWLEISTGDFFQRYSGTPASPTGVYPDYSSVNPLVTLVVADSATGSEIDADNLQVTWFFNDVQIFPPGAGLNAQQQAVAALFDILTPAPENDRADDAESHHQLRIKGNLVGLTNGLGGSLKAVVSYIDDSLVSMPFTDWLRYEVSKVSENDYALHISGSPGLTVNWPEGTVLDTSKNRIGYVMLQADLSRGTSAQTPAAVVWSLYSSSAGWQTAPAAMIVSGNQLKVTCDDINGRLLVRAEATTADGQKVYDTTSVADISDPVQIIDNPTPADCMVYEPGAKGYVPEVNDKVTFAPKLSATSEAADVLTSHNGKFDFSFVGSAGNTVKTVANSATAELTAKDFLNSGEKVMVVNISTTF